MLSAEICQWLDASSVSVKMYRHVIRTNEKRQVEKRTCLHVFATSWRRNSLVLTRSNVLKTEICEISRCLREQVFSCGSLSRSKLKEIESDKWCRARKGVWWSRRRRGLDDVCFKKLLMNFVWSKIWWIESFNLFSFKIFSFVYHRSVTILSRSNVFLFI